MSWRERFQQASFRGVLFRFREIEDAPGRRVARHDYPNRRLPLVEDMGQKPREVRFGGYLIGPDYLEQLELLTSACEREGAGELVHPTQGSFRATCMEFRVRQSSREGGMAEVELTFLESEESAAPFASLASATRTESSAEETFLASSATAAAALIVEGEPEFVREAAAESFGRYSDALASTPLTAATSAIAEWRDRLARFSDQVLDQLRSPGVFADTARGIVDDLAGLVGGRLAALSAYRGLMNIGPIVVPGHSRSSSRARGNAVAVSNMVRMYALAGAARAAARAPWESIEQALETRELLRADLDLLIPDLGDEDLGRASELAGLIAASVPPADRGLPSRREFIPPTTQPSLVVAYQLAGNVRGEPDLVARNRPRHPGFLTGGEPLEVLEVG